MSEPDEISLVVLCCVALGSFFGAALALILGFGVASEYAHLLVLG